MVAIRPVKQKTLFTCDDKRIIDYSHFSKIVIDLETVAFYSKSSGKRSVFRRILMFPNFGKGSEAFCSYPARIQ